jgi:hypothetical protein
LTAKLLLQKQLRLPPLLLLLPKHLLPKHLLPLLPLNNPPLNNSRQHLF